MAGCAQLLVYGCIMECLRGFAQCIIERIEMKLYRIKRFRTALYSYEPEGCLCMKNTMPMLTSLYFELIVQSVSHVDERRAARGAVCAYGVCKQGELSWGVHVPAGAGGHLHGQIRDVCGTLCPTLTGV